ncbi:DNA methyltransferase [Salinicoccus roseus]|uniref:DNA methyltransferase n=1 Tax=Salinicoccus roseus TaxID=45670 RepID=UPI00356815E7
MLNKREREYLIELLEKGEKIPEEYKYELFPTTHKEYELNYSGKIRKEDLLANEDGVFPVPLQKEKVFNKNNSDENFDNMLVFGDNLQLLKTIYEDKDPIIKNKVKGKIKLIYIDPPFASSEDFQNKDGARAYNDKIKGAEFVEFLRRRLIIAREILAEDGAILVHLDWKKAHYIKLVLDEVFGENNFLNEIIWYYRRWNIATNLFARNHDTILYYAKNKGQHTFNNLYIPKSDKSSGKGKSWLSVIDEETGKRKSVLQDKQSKGVPMPDVFDISMINPMAKERREVNYPTQKPEALLNRLIQATTNKGDLILDFFGGSGTTAIVSEKLERKWITCDIGKLSYFTMQKRLLKISESNSLDNPKKLYSKEASKFITAQLGVYDLKKAFELEWAEYQQFVSSLFEVEIKGFEVSGYKFDGEKDDFPVKIFDFRKFKDASVDEDYLINLYEVLGNKVSGRIYIVAPANYVSFISDYYDVEDIRFYFLKVPYQVVKELHKIPFQKLRQPRSKKNINNLDDVVGFHFIRKPEVQSRIETQNNSVSIVIEKFQSKYHKDDKGLVLENFESLSAVFIDKDYNGESFVMDEAFYADDLLDKNIVTGDENAIRNELKGKSSHGLRIELSSKGMGNSIMIVYTDIYGNDFTEIHNLSWGE